MKISVFGSSAPLPHDPLYEEAYQLGHLLGQNGYIVLTGGYCGTMEAVSKGAAEGGAKVIGVTCSEIEAWRPLGPNKWVGEEWRCLTLQERLRTLIESCDAAIALPGGIGTLAEILLFWNQQAISLIPKPPLILIGPGWKKTLNSFAETQSRHIKKQDLDLIFFAENVNDAVEKIKQF